MPNPADDREFADLLLEWGFLSRQELDGAIKLHEEACRQAGKPLPLAETLVRYGFLSPRQVAQAQASDTRLVLCCPACSVRFKVRSGTEVGRRCPHCQGALQRDALRDGDEEPALISDTIPVDVLVAKHEAASKFGKYVLLGEVGRGGTSIIQKAWDNEEKIYVALKFLRPQEGSEVDAARVEQLIHEGWRAVNLRHPNIIRVYELGCINRQYYLAMEYLEGFTLAELIRSALSRSRVSPFYEDPLRYLTMLRDVARAVHYAHSRTPPVIHCDLKPANIFIELSWRPYVLDFGVAHELNPAEGGGEAGTLKGSPAYMAPEQVLARPEELDARTDVYGLGAILYDLLTGRPPFTGELQEVLDKNLLVSPPTPSEVLRLRSEISGGTVRDYRIPPEVESVCMKCIEKEKRDRYQSAREVADALTLIVKARPVTQIRKPMTTKAAAVVERGPAPPPAARKEARKPARPVVLLGTAVAILILGGMSALFLRDCGETSQEKRLRRQMDALVRLLQLDAAGNGYREFSETHPDAASQEWTRRRLDDLEAVGEMRAALVAYLCQTTPELLTFELRGQIHREVRVLRATPERIELQTESGLLEIDWSKVEPTQVMKLAQKIPELTPRARVGLASYAAKNSLWMDAAMLIRQLKESPAIRGTALESQMNELETEVRSAGR